jgi:uncharacterized membrane protein
MIERRHQRIWLWVAAIAIVAALVLMLVPQAHSGHAIDWLAILPVLFIGLIAPQTMLASLAIRDSIRTPDTPTLQASFQRPPPFRTA